MPGIHFHWGDDSILFGFLLVFILLDTINVFMETSENCKLRLRYNFSLLFMHNKLILEPAALRADYAAKNAAFLENRKLGFNTFIAGKTVRH